MGQHELNKVNNASFAMKRQIGTVVTSENITRVLVCDMDGRQKKMHLRRDPLYWPVVEYYAEPGLAGVQKTDWDI